MCNAFNHPPECTCGWGGEGHLGGNPNGGLGQTIALPVGITNFDLDCYKSYVNPNAKCPVCGAAVFFYHSPEGGRVFFDELGPPWPKHPCTDKNSQIIKYDGPTVKVPGWKTCDWLPFHLISLRPSVDSCTFSGYIKKGNSNVLIYGYVTNSELSTPIDKLYFVKLESQKYLKMSYFDLIKSKSKELTAIVKNVPSDKKEKQLSIRPGDLMLVKLREINSHNRLVFDSLDKNIIDDLIVEENHLRPVTIKKIKSFTRDEYNMWCKVISVGKKFWIKEYY